MVDGQVYVELTCIYWLPDQPPGPGLAAAAANSAELPAGQTGSACRYLPVWPRLGQEGQTWSSREILERQNHTGRSCIKLQNYPERIPIYLCVYTMRQQAVDRRVPQELLQQLSLRFLLAFFTNGGQTLNANMQTRPSHCGIPMEVTDWCLSAFGWRRRALRVTLNARLTPTTPGAAK